MEHIHKHQITNDNGSKRWDSQHKRGAAQHDEPPSFLLYFLPLFLPTLTPFLSPLLHPSTSFLSPSLPLFDRSRKSGTQCIVESITQALESNGESDKWQKTCKRIILRSGTWHCKSQCLQGSGGRTQSWRPAWATYIRPYLKITITKDPGFRENRSKLMLLLCLSSKSIHGCWCFQVVNGKHQAQV